MQKAGGGQTAEGSGNSDLERPKVVVTQRIHTEALALLEDRCAVVANQRHDPPPPEWLKTNCYDAHVIVAFVPDVIDRDFLAHCPQLRLISCAMKGYDNIDVEECRRRNITVSLVPDLLTIPTAELAIGLMLTLGRSILNGDRYVRSGHFRGWRPAFFGEGLSGRTAGIVGLGRIGQAIATRLLALGMRVLYADPVVDTSSAGHPLKEATRVDLNDLLRESTYILLTLPLTDRTDALVTTELIELMKPSAFLINVARGSIVDEISIARALRTGKLRGYAADVFAFEDIARPDHPQTIFPELVADTSRTVFTPHLGSAIDQVRREIELEAVGNVLRFLDGEALPTL